MSQLGLMVVAIGLSSYNVALFHLLCHAFYKAALFLGAGSIIHAVHDNQDLRKMGGVNFILAFNLLCYANCFPFPLVAFPFLYGLYSKRSDIRISFWEFTFSGVAVYTISLIGAFFTTLYSIKILYLTFLAVPSWP